MTHRANLMAILQHTMINLVVQDRPDLTARQLAVMLIRYLEEGPQTPRDFAARLKVPRPALTRALERLEEFDLVLRRADPTDGRSVLVARTPSGEAYMAEMVAIMEAATGWG